MSENEVKKEESIPVSTHLEIHHKEKSKKKDYIKKLTRNMII